MPEKLFFGDDPQIDERLEDLVSPGMIIDFLGIPTKPYGGSRSIKCPDPNHDDQNFGSCMVSSDGLMCHCFACGKTFSSLDLLTLNGYSYYDAKCQLAEMAGIADEFLPSKKKQEETQKPNKLRLTFRERKLLGLACRPHIKMVTGASVDRPESGNYYRGKDEEFVSYTTMPDPLYDLDEDTLKWLVQGKAIEKFVSLDMTRGKYAPAMEKAGMLDDWNKVIWDMQKELLALNEKFGGKHYTCTQDVVLDHLARFQAFM